MPYYDFINEKNGEVKSLFFHMNDNKEYTDDSGYKWLRLYCSPLASADTKWNEDSSIDFVNKSKNKKGTIGDLWEKSKELSDKRQAKYGKDKVKENFFKNYSTQRHGKKHIKDRPKTIETKDFKISLD